MAHSLTLRGHLARVTGSVYQFRTALCLGAALAIATLLAVACGGREPASSSTSTPSQVQQSPTVLAPSTRVPPSPTPTPQPLSQEAAEFQQFARNIDQAVRARDVGFFMDRLRAFRVVCGEDDIDGTIGGPACEYAGQEYFGISLGFIGSEGAVVPVSAMEERWQRILKQSLDDASDGFGLGVPQLYALDLGPAQTADKPSQLGAVITALVEPPANFAGNGPLRQVVISYWAQQDGDWRITHLSVGFQAEDLLNPGPADDYYSNFVRYQP